MDNLDNNIRPKVLVVDDDTKNLLAIQVILDELSIEVLEATSGEQALQIALETDLALILLDVQMPGMDGFEVARLLAKNKHTKSIPIIFVTAISKDIEFVHKGHELGAVDYLFKPIDATVLKSKVMVFVQYYTQNRSMESLVSELNDIKMHLEGSNERLNQLARIDTVTGLPNRLNFNEFLEEALKVSHKKNQLLAVLYLDLDNFKYVNDTYGHEKGDILLQKVSQRIKNVVRSADFSERPLDTVISRLGGDEFALVIADIGKPANAAVVASRIVDVINKPFKISDASVYIGVSIGIAAYPFAGTTAQALQKSADLAMYKAKQKGKNTYQFFTEELNEENMRHTLIEKSLKQAIEDKEIYVLYQPIFSLETNKVVAFEVNARWCHEQLGNITPDEFIQIAEETSQITPLGTWVCRQVFNDYKNKISKINTDVDVHINLSIRQLETNVFVKSIQSLLKEFSISPDKIVFELTETALMRDSVMLHKKVNELHDIGFGLSVDDFGTGYSSLGRLKDFPIDSIKIDKDFVNKLAETSDSSIILESMVMLARNLNLLSIAEGVETFDQLEFLKKCGCHCAQGFYLARPMQLDKFLEFLEAKHDIPSSS